jgi:hypothetical protein
MADKSKYRRSTVKMLRTAIIKEIVECEEYGLDVRINGLERALEIIEETVPTLPKGPAQTQANPLSKTQLNKAYWHEVVLVGLREDRKDWISKRASELKNK